MAKSNGLLVHLLVFAVSVSMFSPNIFVHGSNNRVRSFKRLDPLLQFKYYDGDYDIRNKHYWASAAFTGVHGYATAGAWILCGIAFAIFMAVKALCNGSRSQLTTHFDRYFLRLFLLLLLFTFLAIIASSFVLAANQTSQKRMKRLKGTLVKAGEDTDTAFLRIIKTMTEMEFLLLPYDQKTTSLLNVTTNRLGNESRNIQHFIDKNGRSIDLAIQTSYLAHVVIVSVNMGVLVAAIVLLLLHWHPGFFIIIFSCWILTTLCWVLTGIDYFIQTFVADTCYALDDFEQNPQNNSLNSILPCLELSYSNKIISQIGQTIHYFITGLNLKITQLLNTFGLDAQDDNILGAKKICDPFSAAPDHSYENENCQEDEIPIGDLPNILARFTCDTETITDTCKSNGKLLPESTYQMARAYSVSIQDMINIYPDLKSLTECAKVKEAFSDVVSHQCKPLKLTIRVLWSSVLSLSILMILLVFIWVAKAFQDKGRNYSNFSMFPNST